MADVNFRKLNNAKRPHRMHVIEQREVRRNGLAVHISDGAKKNERERERIPKPHL